MTTTLTVLATIATLFAGWRATRRTRFFLHIFQLETYKFDRYARWLSDRVRSAVVRLSHVVGAGLLGLAAAGFAFYDAGWVAIGLLFLWTLAFISSRRYRSTQEKKPLAFTARLTRLTVAAGLVAILPLGLGAFYGWHTGDPSGVF